MPISKSGIPHSYYHKLHGAMHLRRIIEPGMLPHVLMDRFETATSEQFTKMILNSERKHPIIGRTSSTEDTGEADWRVQPRKKFATMAENPYIEKEVAEFLYRVEHDHEKLQIFAVHLPVSYAVLEIGLEINHGNWYYTMDVRIFDPPLSTSEDCTFRAYSAFYVEMGRVESNKIEITTAIPNEYSKAHAMSVARGCVPAILQEFEPESGRSEVRFVVYAHDSNLYAYDWLLKK